MQTTPAPHCRRRFLAALIVPALLAAPLPLLAEVSLPDIFSEHMLLQQSPQTAIWGWAAPGETVKVQLAGQSAQATAGEDGTWRLRLDLSKVGPGPHTMVAEGANRLEVKDVAVGEVWIAAGQSNMEFRLPRAIGAEELLPKCADPLLRQFLVEGQPNPTPQTKIRGRWQAISPGTAKNFTAVGYFFAREVREKTGAPVGLVCAAIGSTPSEAWTSYEALARDAELKASSDRKLEILQNYPKYKSDYAAAFQAWCQKYGREDRPDPEVARTFASFTEKSGWTHVKLPGKLTGGNLPATGAVWVVRTFNFNASYAGKPMPLSMGKPTGFDALWWNGENIGEKTLENQRGHGEGRQYTIPGAKVKEGTNTLALRLYSPIDDLAIEGKLTHAGEWAAKAEFALPPMSEDALKEAPAPLANLPDAKKTSGLLFNSYINPLIPYTIKGAIWYQGENNAERAAQYRTAFPLLINDWRARWGQGDFPFYFCQLANHDPKRPVPGDHPWAELREAQSSALSLPNTGQAVLIDAGEAGDIHPRDKATAGRRLAAIALARDYGKGTPFSGPVYASSAREGNAIRVRFNHADGGLVAQPLPAEVWLESASNRKVPLVRNRPESQLEGFAIAGKDGKWAWADARVDGDSVLVSAPEVSLPEHVRYAWATNPTCNLANGAGFPAAPFRTDKFPGLTDGAKY